MLKAGLKVFILSLMTTSVALAYSARSYKGEYVDNYIAPPPPPTAPAPCPVTCPDEYNGPSPYLGFSAGALYNYGNVSKTFEGLSGILSLGIGGSAQTAYLAAEVFALDTGNLRDYADPGTSLRTDWSYGFSLLPGFYVIPHTLGYARISVIRTYFKGQNHWANGGQAGVGTQIEISHQWSLRGEFLYTKYQSFGDVSSPQSTGFNAGIVYRFF